MPHRYSLRTSTSAVVYGGKVNTETTEMKTKVTRMHNPPHPGEVLQDTVFGEAGLSVSEFAKRLGVSRVALSRVVNGRAAISADMALRLAAALGGSAESWLRMQASYDLWQASKKRRPKVEPLKIAA
jgi:antitoxin HigA-1